MIATRFRMLFAIALLSFATASPATLYVVPPNAIVVSPPSAPAGTPRNIAVTIWAQQNCGPSDGFLDASAVESNQVLVIQLVRIVGTPPPCSSAPVAHTINFSHVPTREGELRVIALSASGPWYAEGSLTTRNTPTLRSRFDLTGMWFDPATHGSGLTFVHAASRSDAVFGTWFLYDAQRNPRWYSIQGVSWKQGGLEAEGGLYVSSAQADVCSRASAGCPATASIVSPMAKVRIVMKSATEARIDALRIDDGSVIFSSNIVKAPIP